MSLGPQCWSCRQRRVRCDSAVPRCRKCSDKHIECPGYSKTKPLVWVNGPRSKISRKQRRRTALSSDEQPATSTSLQLADKVEVEPDSSSGSLEVSLQNLPMTLTKLTETEIMVYSVEYYNRYQAPYMVAIDSPNNPHRIPLKFWQHIPEAVLHLVVSGVASDASIRAIATSGFGNSSRAISCPLPKEVFRHRARALQDLNGMLCNPQKQTNDLTLLAVLAMLLADLQQSAFGGWKVHLDGARRIVQLRGGLGVLINRNFTDAFLSIFVLIEVLSTTTSVTPTDLEATALQSQYLQISTRWDRSTSRSCIACPDTLFETIIKINLLRVVAKQAGMDASMKKHVRDILEPVLTFSPEDWACQFCSGKQSERDSDRIVTGQGQHYGTEPLEGSKSHPGDGDFISWTCLARVYRAAVTLYCTHALVLDLEAFPLAPFLTTLSDVHWLRRDALQTMLSNFPLILSGRNGFCILKSAFWPVFVAGLEAEPADKELKNLISCILREMTREVAVLGPHDAEVFLQEKWASDAMPGAASQRTWDEAFAGLTDGCIFSL